MLLDLEKYYRTIEGDRAVVLSLKLEPEQAADKLFCALISVQKASGKVYQRCSLEGYVYGLREKPFLLEVQPPWVNFPMDTPVMYQNGRTLAWLRGHYAGFLPLASGALAPQVWNDCKTSWAGTYKVRVHDCRLPSSFISID